VRGKSKSIGNAEKYWNETGRTPGDTMT